MADNPYLALLDPETANALPGGMRRRVLNEGPQSDATEPVRTFDQFKGNWAAEAGRSIIANQVNDYGTALPALVRGLAGDEQGMQRGFQQYERNAEEARQLGPQIQSFEDAKQAGGGIGNYGAALGYEAANLVPTVLSAIATDGVAGLGTKLAVKGAVRRGLAREIESDALVQAGRDALSRRLTAEAAAKQEARAAARAASGGVVDEGAVSAAINTADAQATKQMRRAAMSEAARIAGRTPRYADLADEAGKWAGRAAATLATAPQMLGGAAQDLADPNATQGDAALHAGGALAGAAFGLIPAERFVGMFGAKAAPGVAAEADRFLVRLAKQTGGQGAAGGIGALGQTASALAAHAAVQRDPSVLYDDNAWNQYVSSFGSGALLGALMGGVGEGSKSAARGARTAVQKGYSSVRDLLRAGADKVTARASQLNERRKARFSPGDEIPLDEGEAAPSTSNRFVDALRRGAGKAKEKFDGIRNDLQRDEVADSVADELAKRIEAGQPIQIPGRVRGIDALPLKFKTPLQSQLMGYVREDSPLWNDPPTAQRVARSLEKLFQERPDDADKSHLNQQDMQHFDALVQSGSMSRETLASMQMLGNIAAGGDKVARAYSEGVGDKGDGALTEQLRSALKDTTYEDAGAEGDRANNTLSEVQGLPTERPSDRVRSARVDVRAAQERLRQAPNDDARAAAQADLDAARSKGGEALADLRKELTGPASDRRKFGANIFDAPVITDRSPEGARRSAAAFEEAIKEPGRVEIQGASLPGRVEGVTLDYRRAIGLDTIISRKVAELSPQFDAGAEGQRALRRAATMEAFGDLREAGIKVKPESITKGRIYVGKDEAGTRRLVGELTGTDVAKLRGELQEAAGPKQEPGDFTGPPDNRRLTEVGGDGIDAPKEREAGNGDFDLDNGGEALGPRSAPEGEPVPGGFVPTQSPVTNVRFGKDGEVAVTHARLPTEKTDAIDRKEAAREKRFLEASATKKKIHDAVRKAGGSVDSDKFKRWTERHFGETHLDNMSVKKLHEVLDAVNEAAASKSARALREEAPARREKTSKPPEPLVPGAKLADATRNRPDLPRADAEATPEKTNVGTRRVVKKSDVQHDETAGSGKKSEGDAPDLPKENELVGALLKAAGITRKLRVESEGASDPHYGGNYRKSTGRIGMNDSLRGPARMETLLHEVGHHFFWNEIAKHVGWDVVESGNLTLEGSIAALKAGNPKLHDALMRDFEAFRASGANSKPYHRATEFGKAKHYDDPALALHEWVADNVARALSRQKKPVGIVGEFFANIATAFRRAWNMLVRTGRAEEFTAAKSVDDWVRKTFAEQAKKDAALAKKNAEIDALGPRRGKGYRPENDPHAFNPATDEKGFKDWISTKLPVEARKILDRVLNRPEVIKQMRGIINAIEDAPTRDNLLAGLDDAQGGLENRIAAAYTLWAKGMLRNKDGQDLLFGHGDAARELVNLSGDGTYAQRIFSDIANGTIDRVVRAGGTYDARALEARRRGKFQRAVNKASAAYDKAVEPLSVAFSSGFARMRDSGVPELRKFAALIHRPFGTTGDEEGFTTAVTHRMPIFTRKATNIFSGLTARQARTAMDMLARQMDESHPKWASKPEAARQAVTRMRALYGRAFAYAKKAGVDIGSRGETFHPVLFDFNNPRARDTLVELYSQPKFEADIRELFGYKTPEGRVPSDKPIEDLIANLVDGALGDGQMHDPVTDTDAPKFRSQNYRISQFIYDHGDAADIKKFASTQIRNPAEAIARYFEPLVKNAEYTRRFGGGKLAKMTARMKEQGATPEQIGEALNQLRAALGTYGADGSPMLRAVSPALANKLKGPKVRKAVQTAQAYQNARLLPLSLLSSLVDPMGVAVRTGGDFGLAWDGFKSGIKALVNKEHRAELDRALEDLGATDDLLTVENLYGGQGEGVARKINDFVFKVNGMQKWVHTTRLMALRAAHGFLLKHADMKSDTSTRYMQELKLQRGDINTETVTRPDGSTYQQVKLLTPEQRSAAKKAGDTDALARDARVREALMRFVDEAILRPHSLQVPLWHNDPYMGLFTQYKTFAYAIYDQIAGRIGREVRHGNNKVMLAAMAYVPIAAAAELIREFLQYGPDGNPQRAQWGPGEYAVLGAQKTGLFGPKYDVYTGVRGDVQKRSFPGSSQLGPTLNQISDLGDAFEGRRGLGNEIESAGPGAALYRHWDADNAPTNDTRT